MSDSSIVNKVFFPNPVKRVTYEIDPKLPTGPPGDFVLSDTGRLLKSALDYDGIANDLIEDYNNLITVRIKNTITSTRIPITTLKINDFLTKNKLTIDDLKNISDFTRSYRRELYLKFIDMKIDSPMRNGAPLYPHQVRASHDSYMATIKVQIALEIIEYVGKKKITRTVGFSSATDPVFVSVGNLPIMTGSVVDNLKNITPKSRWVNYGEDPRDPLAQFIIGGNNYTIFLKDGLRMKRIFNFKSSGGEKISSMTYSSPRATRYVKLNKNKFGEIAIVTYDTKDIKKTKIEKEYPDNINILTFMRFMFGITVDSIKKSIRTFVRKNDYSKIINYLAITIEKDEYNGDPVTHISGLMGDYLNQSDETKRKFLKQKYRLMFNGEVYSHIEDQKWSKEVKDQRKLTLLIIQLSRYIEYLTNLRYGDNRNSWFNKSIFNASDTIHKQFYFVWNQIVDDLGEKLSITYKDYDFDKESIDSKANFSRYLLVLGTARQKLESYEGKSRVGLGSRFESCFKDKKWGPLKTTKDDGRSDIVLKGTSIIERYSLITKINNRAPVENHDLKLRAVKASGMGYEDIVETPESNKCGLRTNKAITCWVSTENDDSSIINDVMKTYGFTNKSEPHLGKTMCLINGIPIGWCNGLEIKNLVMNKKILGYYPKDISVIYDDYDNFVYIHTNRSRPTRPLLVVENNELLIDRKNLWGETRFDVLLKAGVVTYVDAWETKYISIAPSVKDVRNHRIKIQKLRDDWTFLVNKYTDTYGEEPRDFVPEDLGVYYKLLIEKLEKERSMAQPKLEDLREDFNELQKKIREIEKEVKSLVNGKTQKDKEILLAEFLNENLDINIDPRDAIKYLDSFLSGKYDELSLLNRDIITVSNLIEGHQRAVIRYSRYNHSSVRKLINNFISDLDLKVIEVLKLILSTFSSDLSYSQKLDILLTNIPKIFDTRVLLREIFNYETEIIIDKGNISEKNDYYCKSLARIRDILELIDIIRKKNDSLRFILAKRFLNETRMSLLIELGSLDEIIENLEDRLLEEVDNIKSKQIQREITPLNQNKILRANALKQIKLAKGEYYQVKRKKYSYSELDSDAVLGVNSSLIPAWNHNDNVRNAYASVQTKQSLTSVSIIDLVRFATSAKRLSHGERPIYEPQLFEHYGIDKSPYGQMVIMAILDMGWNREDSIVLRKKSVDQGKMQMVIFKTHTKSLEKGRSEGKNVQYFFGASPGSRSNTSYVNIDDKGLAKVGSYIAIGDVIIASYIVTRTNGVETFIDTPLIAVIGQQGVVDLADISINSDGIPVANVRVRNVRKPEVGDKFTTRSAQKTVISRIAEDDELPRSEHLGIFPDVFMNGLAVPSRMTINQLKEMYASIHGALTGRRVDASGDERIEKYQRSMEKYGIDISGKVWFTEPKTGRRMNGKVFMAPVYWVALSHHAEDKIQFRGKGGVDARTRRPAGGKSKGGGIKIGEMERDAIISHAAFLVLKDRFCDAGGGVDVVWCRDCGVPGGVKPGDIFKGESIFKCTQCGTRSKEKLGICTVPYVLLNTRSQLAGMGINLTLRFNLKK